MDNDKIKLRLPFSKLPITIGTIVFVMPLITYLLTYCYNCGYNRYFGIPPLFTTYYIGGVLGNLFRTFIVLFTAFMIIFIFSYIKSIFVEKPNKQNLKLKYIFSLIRILLLTIAFGLSLYYYQSISITPAFLLMSVSLLIFCTIAILASATLCYLEIIGKLYDKHIEEHTANDFKILITSFPRNKFLLTFVNKAFNSPILKRTSDILFIFIFLVAIALSTFVFGNISAENQVKYCVMNDNAIVVTSNGDDIIVVPFNTKTTTFSDKFIIVSKEKNTYENRTITNLKLNNDEHYEMLNY